MLYMASVIVNTEQQVLIEAVKELKRLEMLVAEPHNSESQRQFLRQEIVQLKQLIRVRVC